MSLRYRPEGRRVEVCATSWLPALRPPDRGHERRAGSPHQPAICTSLRVRRYLALETEWLSVYHNRCAQSDAALAGCRQGNAAAPRPRREGNTVHSLTPGPRRRRPLRDGDWVDRAFALARSDLFASAPSLQQMLADAAATRSVARHRPMRPRRPTSSRSCDHPTLQGASRSRWPRRNRASSRPRRA